MMINDVKLTRLYTTTVTVQLSEVKSTLFTAQQIALAHLGPAHNIFERQADLIKDGDSDGGAWDAQVDYDKARTEA